MTNKHQPVKEAWFVYCCGCHQGYQQQGKRPYCCGACGDMNIRIGPSLKKEEKNGTS